MKNTRLFSSRLYVSSLPSPAGKNDTISEEDVGNTAITAIPYGPKQQLWYDIPLPPGASVAPPLKDPNRTYESVPPSDVHGNFPKIDYTKFETRLNRSFAP